jgi:tetratricopeptide (TPR) repeat protein
MLVDLKKSAIADDIERMLAQAESFLADANYEKAIHQLVVYLDRKPNNSETWVKLGEIYENIGKKKESIEAYSKAAFYMDDIIIDGEDSIITLTTRQSNAIIKEHMNEYSIEIRALGKGTSNMSLNISRKNLMPVNTFNGCIEAAKTTLVSSNNYETSDWFDIYEEGEYLTMSGGFNCAIWQFRDADGHIVELNDTKTTYRLTNNNSQYNQHNATVLIPKGRNIKSVRVTFVDHASAAQSGSLDIPVSITYGRIPRNYEHAERIQITIPDLAGNAVIYYSGGKWSADGAEESELLNRLPQIQLYQGDTLDMIGDLCGIIAIGEISGEFYDGNGEYGVRWPVDGVGSIVERVGDAENLNCNYMIGSEWAGAYNNDFDDIYPWSDIKLCAVDDRGRITYEGEDSFAIDGRRGDIMVEIPIHYVKREIRDGYEYIWISGKQHEGYTIDPSFVTADGVKENIYIGAYLSSIEAEAKRISSVSGTHPLIKMSFDEIRGLIEMAPGFHEIDLYALLTVQRLFLIETAIKNSQDIFKGFTAGNFGGSNPADTAVYALSSSDGLANQIQLSRTTGSAKYEIGDAITLFDVPNEYADRMWGYSSGEEKQFYDVLKLFENNETWQRQIMEIEDNHDGTINLKFSGPSVNIFANKTTITHIPPINGQTDIIEYHTGAVVRAEGLSSFKYRYIENLYAVCTFIGGATVSQQIVTLKYPDGSESVLNYLLPIQSGTPTENISLKESTILRMGYDPDNPLIMLPEKLGGGGSESFGDSWFYGGGSGTAVLTSGLTWDLREYAGMFAYRAASASGSSVEQGSRIMYR